MNLLKLLILSIGMSAATTGLAQEGNVCQSMCASEQRVCRVDAASQATERPLAPSEISQRNPLARVAEGEVAGHGTRALATTGQTNRRLDRIGACEKSFEQCRRSCAATPVER